MKTFVLTANHVEEIITRIGVDTLMKELIKKMHLAFESFDPKKTIIPVRSGFNYKAPNLGLVEWMPLYENGKDITIKLVGYHPDNPERSSLPTILSTISTYCTETGHLKSIMDGVLPTALRTGAASAVASLALALPDSKNIGLIGCGAQSVTQLHALSLVFPIDKVRIFDVDQCCMDDFAHRCQSFDHGVEIIPASIDEILAHSDIISTATSIDIDEGPLFSKYALQPHCHINAVGADFPGKNELPKDLLQNSYVTPDFLTQALIEGECEQLDRSEIGEELDQVIKRPSEFAKYQDQWTVFDSTGYPLEDMVIKNCLIDHARELEIGSYIALENTFMDVKNPYGFLHADSSDRLTAKELTKISEGLIAVKA